VNNPVHVIRGWWEELLGFSSVIGDVRQTLRDHRVTRAGDMELVSTERAAALRAARSGCTHSPACPPATAPHRQSAAVVFRDDRFIYLCNGLTLSVRDHVPDRIPADFRLRVDDEEADTSAPQEVTHP
jgi:hypothetical protein